MEVGRKAEKTGLSRRNFMQWAGALSATAAMYGCSGGSEEEPVVTQQADLVIDKTVKEVNHGHHVHCGGSCMLKLHIKNGRVLKITSAGDMSYEKAKANADKLFAADPKYGIVAGVWGGSEAADESLAPIQRRACLKGLAEVQRIYSPDRIKYPLKQTKERGNRNGFVRITWDEAYDDIVTMYNNMKSRVSTLGYLPILDSGGITNKLGNYVAMFGNASYGGLTDAWYASIGEYTKIKTNTALDMLNSKLIINWSNDSRVTRNQLPFYMIKAKEAGIPVIVIDHRHTDTVSAMGTGAGDVPAWISVRQGMDTALMAAMAYVIYKKGLHQEQFIRDYCFGFYPGDSVVSQSAEKHPVTKAAYTGQRFTVPAGQSFLEYLISLEYDWGKVGTAVNQWNNMNADDWDYTPVAAGSSGYYAVLAEAERLTGVKADVIEKLAIKYATTSPAFIHSAYNGGANRAQAGMYFSWMLIALSAMTGNINKRGGGPGEIRFGDGYLIPLGAEPASITPPTVGKAINVARWQLSDVVYTGRDFRTAAQLQEDVKVATGIDLGASAEVKIEMVYRGSGDTSIFNQSPTLTKNMKAFCDKTIIKHIVAHELHMSTEASIADIILPVNHNFERSYFTNRYTDDRLAVNGPLKPLYEAKPDWLILQELAVKLGLESERAGGASDEEIMKIQWEGASIPAGYLSIDPSAELPSYEKMIEEANIQLPVPLNKTIVQLENVQPGKYPNDTGYINFWSPYLAGRQRAPLGVYRAQHVRPEESYEDILDNGGRVGAKPGHMYTLQLSTPHIIQRAHSQYDNIAVLKDLLPQVVQMHPVDAGKRGISNGDMVYIYSDNGCIKLKAEVTRRTQPNIIVVGQGAWYRASTETYEAWFDTNGDGVEEKHVVPVDVGGNVNSLIKGRPTGAGDLLIPNGFILPTVGNLCEVSKVHPDKI